LIFFTDLKNYFSQGSSGSSLSSHGSDIVAIVEDVPLEGNVLPAIEEGVAIEGDVLPSIEHDEEDEQVQEGITDFNPYHIIFYPGLRIPIERFYACWGLVLKCYELRTRQHKMLNINVLRPLKHYFPKDLMNFG
jgi:hypothetical protein